MSSASTEFATSGRMGLYEPIHQVSMWEGTFRSEFNPNTGPSLMEQMDDAKLGNKSEYTSYESLGPFGNHQEIPDTEEVPNKVQRRLAQNREAARRSRLRKKAYVQRLEKCRLRLMQLETEVERYRSQGVYTGGALNTSHIGFSVPANSATATFEMKYEHWVEEQQRQNSELRKMLQAQTSELELQILVENGLKHYYNLFQMKADAAKADVFYLMFGMWRTSAEHLFHWLGGFRPSELLNLQPLTDRQRLAFGNLRLSCQQAEEALTKGMERLQQALAVSIAVDLSGTGNLGRQMASAMEKLNALELFVNQADHLREQTLQQMYRVLTVHQAARGLLALGEFFERLRALSSLWAANRAHQQPGFLQ
ncbi:transcription factor TGA1-like isoform X2 [Diospyros lotus]|uniref:transcription factor TGA1-like isoform X2 n=1 Tax=Diospyros lotus TaxID=55363 RepID=UPI00225A1267|nr:transcription factor TGA1-like isoform X2 [Diospyros lotus]